MGEVHTGLLRGRDPVAGDVARALVDLVSGEPVLVSERPRSCVRSPGRPVGVDCPLDAGGSGRQVRGIGTVIQRAAITDGHVLQGSAYVTLAQAAQSARQPWSHYLARPGVVEAIGRTGWADLAASFAAARLPGAALDLGGIAAQAADRVQQSVRVPPGAGTQPGVREPGRPRLRAARTRLRWIAEITPLPPPRGSVNPAHGSVNPSRGSGNAPRGSESGPGPETPAGVQFVIRGGAVHGDEARVLRFSAPPDTEPGRLAAVAEDVALHDWLLTALLEIMRKAAIGVLPREEAIERLLPAIDYLMHLWLPGARGDALSDRVWGALESRAGLSRHWDLLVNRIRDQLAVAGLHPAVRR
ncbi:SCO2521 family protein [Actinoplanes sp. NPDC051411]|uniref:SCO2521 family protein n=1 Tax=Actinoplanes sp. NPDC051411 TaxID=3155522 RepID=UPI0034133F94